MLTPKTLTSLKDETFLESVFYFPRLRSTNDTALQHALDSEVPLPALFVTPNQTTGRGREGARWWSGKGGLTFSLLIDPLSMSLKQSRWPQLSLWTALAVRDGLTHFVPPSQLFLKWPNDVFLCQRKVCGILIEASTRHPSRLVVGIGVNVNNSFLSGNAAEAEEGVRATATSLADVRKTRTSRIEVLRITLLSLENRWLECAEDTDLRTSWMPHCILSGKRVEWSSGNATLGGFCGGVDREGALLLTDSEGLHRCFGGKIVSFAT